MTTPWTLPSVIEQYSEPGFENDHVTWQEIDNFSAIKNLDGRSIKASRDLVRIARDPRHDIQEKTYYLKVLNFNFVNLPAVPTGISLKLSMNRGGRITDDTIQLCLNGNLIGDNQASFDLTPIKIYGGENNLWNCNLTTADLLDPTFGVTLRFKSHPNWPHKSTPLIDAVELRIH